MRLSSMLIALLSAGIAAGCSAHADDLLALEQSSELAIVEAKTAFVDAKGEVGGDFEWTLILVPKGATSASLQASGLDVQTSERIESRSGTFSTQHSMALVSSGPVAFAVWPPAAGELQRVFFVKGSKRLQVSVRINLSPRPEVTGLTTTN